MIEFKFDVLEILVKPRIDDLSDVVVRVHWQLFAQDGELFGRVTRGTVMSPPSSDNFTDFTNLTEDQVLSWIKATVDWNEVEQAALADLERVRNPETVSKNRPWDRSPYHSDMRWVMVIDGEAVGGVQAWHSDTVNRILEQHGFTERFPDQDTTLQQQMAPWDDPLHLNDRVSIYLADIVPNPSPPQDPFWEMDTLRFTVQDRRVRVEIVTDYMPMDVLKNRLRGVVEQQVQERLWLPFRISGQDADVEISINQQQYTTLTTAGVVYDRSNWLWAIPDEQRATLEQAMQSKAQECLLWSADLQRRIYSSTSVDELRDLGIV